MFKLIYKWTDKIKEKVASLSDKMSEKGQGMVEYAMILAAVAIIAVAVLWNGDNSLSATIKQAFINASGQINQANTQSGAGLSSGSSGSSGGSGGN